MLISTIVAIGLVTTGQDASPPSSEKAIVDVTDAAIARLKAGEAEDAVVLLGAPIEIYSARLPDDKAAYCSTSMEESFINMTIAKTQEQDAMEAAAEAEAMVAEDAESGT